MKKNNKKGFTLIELLAVIVILGILLAIAIPAVSKYINNARKSTFIANVQSYAKAAKNEALSSTYMLPVNNKEATVIPFKALEKAIENGGKTSPYGAEWNQDSSYVMIVNEGTKDETVPVYYVFAIDAKGYGIGEDSSAKAIAYDSLKDGNVVQLGASTTLPAASAASSMNVTITTEYDTTGKLKTNGD